VTRTDDDTWDAASGVGATATMVAAGRAMASQDPRHLIDDPYAKPLVEAVGLDFFTKQVNGELDTADLDSQSVARVQALVDEVAVRTRFYDDYFMSAANAGVRQAVILASGLDARAYRLDWPAPMVVYEIDQPAVIEFKTGVLARLGAQPRAELRCIAADLREDWPAALRAAGFDPQLPAAWSAEGLLMYLPAAAQQRLFDAVTALSAPRSTLAADYVARPASIDAATAQRVTADWRDKGFGLDMAAMTFADDRCDVPAYLTGKGWRVEATPRADLFARYGVEPAADTSDLTGQTSYVSATFAGAASR
jgi:methyltransferase (TIGR00027 family)